MTARYPETVNLPFNRAVLGDGFDLVPPGSDESTEQGWLVALRSGNLVVRPEGEGFVLPAGPADWLPPGVETITFGRWQGRPVRAVAIPRETEVPPPLQAEPFNVSDDRLDDLLLTLGGIGQQVLHWEQGSRFCPRCGGSLERLPGSWGKRCVPCRTEHFPHIHPCAIVLVRRGEEFLLIRKPEWPEGRYSLVAGFLDMGESLEECAVREVQEETGVAVTNLSYLGSQCWPFPSQLMAGYLADWAGGEICIDSTEIADARWFCPADPPPALPGRRSIARWIIDRFALNQGGT